MQELRSHNHHVFFNKDVFQENSIEYGVKLLSLTYQSPTQHAVKHMVVKYLVAILNASIISLVGFNLINTKFSEHLFEIVRKCEWLILLFQVSKL